MKPSELQEKTCHQFDCAIKTVIRHRAIDFYRAIRRSEKKEMPFAEIMDDLLNSIGTEDTYSTDYVAVFEVCGEKVSIEDEQLARALKAIEERKRNIVLQYFFIGDTDTYIGKMLDCSRANVTKCRIQALDKLKQLIEEEKEKWSWSFQKMSILLLLHFLKSFRSILLLVYLLAKLLISQACKLLILFVQTNICAIR